MIETVPSKKELRKAANRKYQDKLKKLPQEEQDALKLKRKNARFQSQEDKENHVKKVQNCQKRKRESMTEEDVRAFKRHKSEQQAAHYLEKKQTLEKIRKDEAALVKVYPSTPQQLTLCIINCTIPYSLCLNVVFYVKTKSKHINGTEELVLCCYVFFSARDSIHFTSSNKLVGLRWSKTLSL